MMFNRQLTLGNAFGTTLTIHPSWLLILPFAVFTLVTLNLEPFLEATVAALLMFGSVLLSAIVRLWAAQRHGLRWPSMTLFLVGGSVQRTTRSTPVQEARIELAGVGINLLLATLFGTLWQLLPSGALGIEMEIVSLFNIMLALFALLLRLSPNHDNLLHAALVSTIGKSGSHTVMILIHIVALGLFGISSLFAISLGWLAFGWWFLIAWMLSQLTSLAEQHGEYREGLPYAQSEAGSVTEAGISAEIETR